MKYIVTILTLVGLLGSCAKFQKASLDNASKSYGIEIVRLDKMQSELIGNSGSVAVQEMVINCPQESKILIEDVLRIGSVNDSDLEAKVSHYFKCDPVKMQLIKDVEEKYDNLGELGKELKRAFEQLEAEVPGIHMPRFYTQISGFNQSIVVGDSIVGISLDKYMGTDYAPYHKLYYNRQIEQMKPSRIVEDCLHYWLESKLPLENFKSASLLDIMIYFGKINWVVAQIAGKDKNGDGRFYYLKEKDAQIEQEWAHMSKRLLTKALALSTDQQNIKYIQFGMQQFVSPKTDGLLGVGVPAGLRFVNDYMHSSSQPTITQLLKKPSADLLHEAGYKIH